MKHTFTHILQSDPKKWMIKYVSLSYRYVCDIIIYFTTLYNNYNFSIQFIILLTIDKFSDKLCKIILIYSPRSDRLHSGDLKLTFQQQPAERYTIKQQIKTSWRKSEGFKIIWSKSISTKRMLPFPPRMWAVVSFC